MPSDLLMEKRKHAQRKGGGSSKLEGTLGIYPWWSLLMGHLEHVSCLKISSSFQILFGRELLVACLILHKFVGCVTLRHQSSKGFLFISMVVASRLSACHFAAYTQRSLLQVGFLQDLCVFALGDPIQRWAPTQWGIGELVELHWGMSFAAISSIQPENFRYVLG